jgi:glycine cleavage system H protein
MVEILIIPVFLVFVVSLGVLTIGLIYKTFREALPPKGPLRLPWTQGLKEGVLYYHPGHTWARAAGRGLAAVGVDELGSKVIGAVEAVTLPKPGTRLRQGQVAWSLKHRGRTVELVSPVTGTVVAVNEKLERDPTLITNSPQMKGWVFKTEMLETKRDLRNLFTGALAMKLVDLSKDWICASFFSSPLQPSYRPTAQDGGELVEGIGDRLNDEQWERLISKLFLSQ